MKVTNQQFVEAIRKYLETDNIQFDYQTEISANTAKYIGDGNNNGVIVAATGLGKTVAMGSISRALIEAFPNERILVLAPTKDLVGQSYDDFVDVVVIDPNKIGLYHSDIGRNERREALGKQVLITTIQSYTKLSSAGIIKPDDFLLLNIDEAHKANGPQTKQQLSNIITEIYTLAWTATDKFADGTDVGEQLFNKKNDYIFHEPLDIAIQKGRLCEVANIILRTNVDASDLPIGELTQAQQEKLASRIGRDEKAIELSLNYVDEKTGIAFKDQTSVWYCSGVKHAEAVAKKLNAAHGPGYAEVISGDTPKNERKRLIAAHKSGELKALCNADLLIAGYNNKRASLCYILRDVQSESNFVQMVGRITRLFDEMPDKFSFVISLIDNGRKCLNLADIFGSLNLEHKEKKTRKKGSRGGREGGGETIDYSLDIDVKDIITTDEGYFELKKQIQQQIDERADPEKPEEYLRKQDLGQLLKIETRNKDFTELWNDLEAQFKKNKKAYINEAQIYCGIFRNVAITSFYVHKSAKELFEEKLNIFNKEKPDGYLGKVDFTKVLKIKSNNPNFRELWNDLEAQFKKNKKAYINEAQIYCGIFRSGAHTSFCVHESAKELFEEKLNIVAKEKPDGYLEQFNFTRLLKTSKSSIFKALWNDLEAQFKTNKKAYIGEIEIVCGLFRNTSLTSFYVHEKERDVILAELERMKQEKKNLPNLTEIKNAEVPANKSAQLGQNPK
jgi:superfamily II DNA or RNA helicase